MYLPANIKFLRKKMRKTQDALSAEVNIGRTTIANYEAGISEPNLENLLAFSNYFGISIDDLLSKNMADDARPIKKTLFSKVHFQTTLFL